MSSQMARMLVVHAAHPHCHVGHRFQEVTELTISRGCKCLKEKEPAVVHM